MAGFCPMCRAELANSQVCPNGHRQGAGAEVGEELEIVPPKAPPARRLFGSGIEFTVYAVLLGIMVILSLVSFGFLDTLMVPLLLVLISLRDARAGLYSIGKRISKMRVVDARSGRAVDNLQAFKRNSYYLALTLLMLFPLIVSDVLAALLFVLCIGIDVGLILLSETGRRIGDRWANTQVVMQAKKAHPSE